MTSLRLALIAPACALLGACATTAPQTRPPPRQPQPQVVRPEPAPVPPPPRAVAGYRMPEILNEPGLERVIRRDAPALLGQFGDPQLDMREGDMRKLQFAGSACVLDIFLYPLAPGAEPVATWVEARRFSDGAAVDRAACVQALAGAR